MARTLQDVLALCREKDVKIVDFKMTDIGRPVASSEHSR